MEHRDEKKTSVPQFVEEKKLFKKRSFSRHYRIFRKGGLGIADSFFNTVYIMLSEKSVEKEKKRLSDRGEEVSSKQLLEIHAPFLRFFSFVATLVHAVSAFFRSVLRKGDKSHVHHAGLLFLKKHGVEIFLCVLALVVGLYIGIALSFPVVLQAKINGKVIAVVENKHTVDSAINELEDNVEIILGEDFRFPYEVNYSFRRQRANQVTTKAKVSEQLYALVDDFICTGGGLYVDDVLVAVCKDAKDVEDGISDFVSRHQTASESGIFNEIRVVTQAYPTESVITSDQLSQLLDEMSKPLAERKKDPLPEVTPGGSVPNQETALPAVALLSDIDSFPEEETLAPSNRPQSIDKIKLDFYTTQDVSYETTVPYQTVYVESAEHYTSMADVTTKGSEGRSQVTARVYYVNGKEVKRDILTENVIRPAVNRVISLGTKVLPEDQGITAFNTEPGRFIVPRVGMVYSYFGSREDGNHKGWDIPGDEGDSLYASASGTVVVAIGQDGAFSNRPNHLYTGYGYCVVIEHDDGYSTMYAHCSKINVTLGQKVKQGEKIAEVGNTGISEGNHVHFEIIKNDRQVDPALYLYKGKKTIYQ